MEGNIEKDGRKLHHRVSMRREGLEVLWDAQVYDLKNHHLRGESSGSFSVQQAIDNAISDLLRQENHVQ